MPFDKRRQLSFWKRSGRWLRHYMPRTMWGIPLSGVVCILFGVFGVVYWRGALEGDGKSSIRPYVVSVLDEPLVGKVHFNLNIGEGPFTKLFCQQAMEAKTSIKGAVFSYSSQPIHRALGEAQASGKSVSLVIDSQRQTSVFKLAESNEYPTCDIVFSKTSQFSRMHHKFLLFDSELDEAKLFFGSCNLTKSQDFYDPSYFFEVVDRELIHEFRNEFGRLHRGVRGRQKFADPSYRPFACDLQRSNGNTELWFSPGIGNNSFKQRLIEILSSAKSRIDIMMWQFADLDLAKLIIAKANAGVRVRIVVDDESATKADSAVSALKNDTNISIVTDAWRTPEAQMHNAEKPHFNPFMHHHVVIIDGRMIAAGSSNWSYAGFYTNDEANIVSTVDWVVESFRKSFEHFYTEGVGGRPSVLDSH